jgi:hypothetical protein
MRKSDKGSHYATYVSRIIYLQCKREIPSELDSFNLFVRPANIKLHTRFTSDHHIPRHQRKSGTFIHPKRQAILPTPRFLDGFLSKSLSLPIIRNPFLEILHKCCPCTTERRASGSPRRGRPRVYSRESFVRR